MRAIIYWGKGGKVIAELYDNCVEVEIADIKNPEAFSSNEQILKFVNGEITVDLRVGEDGHIDHAVNFLRTEPGILKKLTVLALQPQYPGFGKHLPR